MKECEYCGNKFSRSDNLKRHQNTCQVQNQRNAVLERGVKHQYDTNSAKESNMQSEKNPLLTKNIINSSSTFIEKQILNTLIEKPY